MVNVFTFWLTGCCICALGMTPFSDSQPVHQLKDSQIDAAPPGTLLYSDAGYEIDVEKMNRMKRAITRAAKGMAAVEKLLTGAKKVWTKSQNYRLYKKNGNQESALQDFYSVEPVLTIPIPKEKAKVCLGAWTEFTRSTYRDCWWQTTNLDAGWRCI